MATRQYGTRKVISALEKNKQKLRELGVRKIGLFGSRSKGRASKRSDFDFLVVLDAPTFDNYMELKFMLEKLFAGKVDLVEEAMLKPALSYVKREAVYAKAI